jgi:hypothetical protein
MGGHTVSLIGLEMKTAPTIDQRGEQRSGVGAKGRIFRFVETRSHLIDDFFPVLFTVGADRDSLFAQPPYRQAYQGNKRLDPV